MVRCGRKSDNSGATLLYKLLNRKSRPKLNKEKWSVVKKCSLVSPSVGAGQHSTKLQFSCALLCLDEPISMAKNSALIAGCETHKSSSSDGVP